MLILIGFSNAGQCTARVEWICRVSLRVGDWRRRGVETGNANADKARVERECHELAAGRLQLQLHR